MFGSYVESGTVLNNYAHIFDLLIRLRQAVCHPYLVVHSATAPPTGAGEEAGESGGAAARESEGADVKGSGAGGRGGVAREASVEVLEAPVCGIW